MIMMISVTLNQEELQLEEAISKVGHFQEVIIKVAMST
jgi:hypothetical protein